MGHLIIRLTLALLLVCLHMKGCVTQMVETFEAPEAPIDESALSKLKLLVDANLENFQLAMAKMYELKIYIDGEYTVELTDIIGKSTCSLDCSKATESGLHTVTNLVSEKKVYCQVDTNGRKWVVIQRRQDGSVNFTRNWLDYSKGFGDLAGEFWLGNDNIHALTAAGLTTLHIDMEDWQNIKDTAYYNLFTVAEEQDKYRMTVSGFGGSSYTGDAMTYNTGMQFSTTYHDNDKYMGYNCAQVTGGAGWWWNNCGPSNLNGIYNGTGTTGIYWYTWRGYSSLKAATMMISKP